MGISAEWSDFKFALRLSQEKRWTPEAVVLPSDTLSEIHRDMVRFDAIREHGTKIKQARPERIGQARHEPVHATGRLLARVTGGAGIEGAGMLVREGFADLLGGIGRIATLEAILAEAGIETTVNAPAAHHITVVVP